MPNYEGVLNNCLIKNIHDIYNILYLNYEYKYTTRSLKLILKSKDEDFKEFLRKVDQKNLIEIYHLSIKNEFDSMDDLKLNLEVLKDFLKINC